jgi:hypothetical protein
LRALDQRLLDATTEETERGEACSGSPEGEKRCGGDQVLSVEGENNRRRCMRKKEKKDR